MKTENLIQWIYNEIDEKINLEEHQKEKLNNILNKAMKKQIINKAYQEGIIAGLEKEIKIKVEIDNYTPQRFRML